MVAVALGLPSGTEVRLLLLLLWWLLQVLLWSIQDHMETLLAGSSGQAAGGKVDKAPELAGVCFWEGARWTRRRSSQVCAWGGAGGGRQFDRHACHAWHMLPVTHVTPGTCFSREAGMNRFECHPSLASPVSP